ncbi:MAG: DUF6446 family protein [Paracoccaceae bacterium]
MNGRILVVGMALFALLFGLALWWFQTRGYYETVTGVTSVTIAGVSVPVTGYEGIDADTSPLKMRGCFHAEAAEAIEGPEATEPEPLVAPGWFSCFDAERIEADIDAGAARAVLAEFNQPYGFDRIVAAYPDGRAFQWRRINKCGAASFEGDPPPDGCPPKDD